MSDRTSDSTLTGDVSVGRRIRVLLVDDHAIVRQGTKFFIEQDPEITVVGEAEAPGEALKLAKELDPDVILLDIRLKGGSGIDVARSLQKEGSRARVLVVSAYDFTPYIDALTKAGVRGYVLKDVEQDELVLAIRQVERGEGVLPGPVAANVLDTVSRGKAEPLRQAEDLTVREIEVLELLAQDYRNQDISGRLGISVRTVEAHVANILGKLLRRTFPEVKTLVLTAYDYVQYMKAMARAGAKGYLLKDSNGVDLVRAIHDVYEGRAALPPDVGAKLLDMLADERRTDGDTRLSDLTVREMEILEFVQQSATDREIAERLGLSTKTVNTHVSHILLKLGEPNRSMAVRKAVEVGMLAGLD